MDDWRLRVESVMERLAPWERVTARMGDLNRTGGVGFLFALPGVVSAVVAAVADPRDMGTWRRLRADDGWTRPEWSNLLGEWVLRELDADPNTDAIRVRTRDVIRVTIHRKVGVAVLEDTEDPARSQLLVSPDRGPFREWFRRRFAGRFGDGTNLIRFVPSVDADREGWPSGHPGGVMRWSLEASSSGSSPVVEGPWAPSVSDVARSLSGGRTVMLFGPSGAGKTETAVRAAGTGRVVLIPGTAFGGQLGGRGVSEMADLMGSGVLVVDDLPETSTVAALEEFEVLSRRGVSVAVTVMTNGSRPRFPGLRPGRVDEMLEFRLPDAEGRLALLRHFAPGVDWSEAARHELAEGMTPAYLRELARRVSDPACPVGWLPALRSLAVQREVAT